MIFKLLKRFSFITRPAADVFCGIFFDKKYLKGRHFEVGYIGYYWAIRAIWQKNILRLAPPMPWPTALTCRISKSDAIDFDVDDLNIFQSPGVYLQNFGARISIGAGCYIAPNVGIITANHDPDNLDSHTAGRAVIIGPGCWIGMNAVLLPGVVLGANSIVGAGAIVTKSFPEGGVVLAGNPAMVIRRR